MDKNKLKEFIKEVAEIEELSPKKDPAVRLDNDAYDVVRVKDEWVEITAKSNPTLGFKFKKLKDRHAVCELGCGDIVSNQTVEKRLCHHPEKHWRTKCMTCGCFVSPDGEGFIEGAHQIQAAYIRYFNAIKGIPYKQEFTPASPHSEIKNYGQDRESKWVTDENGNLRLRD